jgi:hypothetical protein
MRLVISNLGAVSVVVLLIGEIPLVLTEGIGAG